MSDILWSPRPREDYIIKINGKNCGVAARSIFNDVPGLWNLFWLHSIRVDLLLKWEEGDPLPSDVTNVLMMAMSDAEVLCGAWTLAELCRCNTPAYFVKHVMKYGTMFKLRTFLEEPENDSWLLFVIDKMKKFGHPLPWNSEVKRHNVIQGRFPLQP